MPPKFLLDEHISRMVARTLARMGIAATAVDDSALAGSDDTVVLRAAIREGRILVTYNNADFPLLLGDAIRAGVVVPGLVFVDSGTIHSSDIGRLARALAALAKRMTAGEANPSAGIFLTKKS
ncbi:MAG: hypothetical protein A2Z34_03970 [Planctomycetes bacterium RBG_16_59_8]|nr:MAG: hypothetical protein A2Z34_03970 [Planctomycetes bacterium RBG_16_59_8]